MGKSKYIEDYNLAKVEEALVSYIIMSSGNKVDDSINESSKVIIDKIDNKFVVYSSKDNDNNSDKGAVILEFKELG